MNQVTKDEYTSFPAFVDNTMFTSMKSCERSFFNRYCRNLSFTENSIHLIAGGALAKALEVTRELLWFSGSKPDEAIEEGVIALLAAYGKFDSAKQAKSPYGMVRAFISYWQEYGTYTDDIKPAKAVIGVSNPVEFNFRIPLPILHPDTGKPIVYTGRLDLLGEKDGINGVLIVDEKTTGALSASWAMQWDMRGQFIGYGWAVRELGFTPAFAVVRGIGIYKTMIKHQEVYVQIPGWKMDRWYAEFIATVTKAVENYKALKFSYSFGDACTQYSGCSFKPLCNVRHEGRVLDQYNRVVWHPEVGEQETLWRSTYGEISPEMEDAFSLGSGD